VKQHGAGILLIATRDRLARDTFIAALVEQRVQKLGASIRAVDGSGNTDTPEGLLVRRIVDAFAEYERLTIQARTKAALAVKRLHRERISRQPPYGWRFTRDRKHLMPELTCSSSHVYHLLNLVKGAVQRRQAVAPPPAATA
jgi:DNA invertase Pin-like site-specific DNA recombinase